MKVWLDFDEDWPLVGWRDTEHYTYEGPFEIPEQLLKDYDDALNKYRKLRHAIIECYEAQGGK